jgi:hypothetical protein
VASCTKKIAYDVYVKRVRKPLVYTLSLLMLASCSSDNKKATEEQVMAFTAQAQANAPYLEKYSYQDDWKTLAEAVCNNIDWMTYGKVSDIVAAYIELPAYSEEVDVVIESALENVCPELKSN